MSENLIALAPIIAEILVFQNKSFYIYRSSCLLDINEIIIHTLGKSIAGRNMQVLIIDNHVLVFDVSIYYFSM